ncbi:MAG: ATP-dependent helicase [Hyphomicrobiales bacterium]|nr:MAG: ATP-dependent helicase [Hyphomicrobiales bacterium]
MSKKLSPEMRRIARSTDRYVEVQAGPGSGKTTAAVARVHHLLMGDPAAKIVLLSFSNTARRNLADRFAKAGVMSQSVLVSTCHSFARRLANSASTGAGTHAADSSDAEPDPDPNTPDFKAMLRAGIKALEKHGVVALDHLLVDEYQDCSRLQSRLVAKLARQAKTTVVLGDRMQSIFGFTSVRYRPLADLLPGVKELPLTLSHRLTAQNAALANALSRPLGVNAIRTKREGKKPHLIEAPDTATMAHWVARRVQRLILDGASPDQIAVLGRNRSTARPVAQELRALGINSTLLGQTTGHMDQVRDVIAVLRVVEMANGMFKHLQANEADGPKMGVRQTRAQFNANLDVELSQAVEHLADQRQWPAFVAELQKLVEGGTADPTGRFSGCVSAYLRLMGGIRANKEMRMDLNAWAPLCRHHQTADALDAHARSLNAKAAVTVTNIHQAKGLEWDHVFVVGVTEGVLPDFRAAGQGTMDNERSLLYVAVTRALERLWVCHAPTFGRQAHRIFEELSSLVDTRRVLRTLSGPRRIDPAS